MIITRAGYMLGEIKQRIHPYTRRTKKTYVPEGIARVISPSLALYKYDKGSEYILARYHVIHIPTGLVIADVEYSDVSMVKRTFEAEQWTFNNGDYMTLHLYNRSFEFSITCKIKYEIKEQTDD